MAPGPGRAPASKPLKPRRAGLTLTAAPGYIVAASGA
jgi:hypothetical protein